MRRLVFVLFMTCLSGIAVANLDEGFKTVPMTERPWCYWWWLNGHVDKESITRDLEAIKRLGFGGLLMFDARGYWDGESHLVLPKPAMQYMDDDWRKQVKFGVEEAARLGLQFSINVSSCGGSLRVPWKLGSDGTKTLICKTVMATNGVAINLNIPRPFAQLHYQDVAVMAVNYTGRCEALDGWVGTRDVPWHKVNFARAHPTHDSPIAWTQADEVRDLTGLKTWLVPEKGQWAVVFFGYRVDSTTDVDVLDAEAVERHFNSTAGRIMDEVGELTGRTLTHCYSVSWENGPPPDWTARMEEAFKQRRGYDLRPWLPVLAGFTLKSGAEARDRFIVDLHRTRTDLFHANCYANMANLAHRRGVKLHSESGGPWARGSAFFGEADQLSFLSANDMPQGEFWWPLTIQNRTQRHFTRGPASAAHIYGKPLVAAEAFTHMDLHYSPYPYLLKRTGDMAFTEGVNHLVWHTFSCSPKEFGVPGIEYFAGTHINENVTWHRQAAPFITYLGRCQHLLQRGLPVVDIAVFAGDNPYQGWRLPPENGQYRASSGSLMVPTSYAYDYFNTDAFLNRTVFKDKRLVLPDGQTYSLLAVDIETNHVSIEALSKLAEFRRAGMPVVFSRRCRPDKSASIVVADALADAGILPDVEGADAYAHRCEGETDIYFVMGEGKTNCTFRVSGRKPELWNAVTGTIDKDVGWETTSDGRTRLMLDLPKNGSMFVIFRGPEETVPRTVRGPLGEASLPKTTLALDGAWEVSFQPGRGAPERVTFATLTDWSKHTDFGIRHFSGTAVYRKSFTLDHEQSRCSTTLCLGELAAVAEVKLNKRRLGIVWTDPWELDLGDALQTGANILEIEVTNTWQNRLIGDAYLPQEERITRSNMRLVKGPRPKNLAVYSGYASEDPLQPSGLFGPVSIRMIRRPVSFTP